MDVLVCGGAGFIGSAFVRQFLQDNPGSRLTNLDSLAAGSNPANLHDIRDDPRYTFVHDTILNRHVVDEQVAAHDTVVNFAAESHVDRSIADASPFIETNIVGTHSILEAVRRHGKRLVHVSTDEVYGDAHGAGRPFAEDSPARPGNPYAATKAAADHLVASYHRTYGIDCVTTRCTNNFGPRQFPEKLVPKAIIRGIRGLRVPVYGDGMQVRSWIHVHDHVAAIASLMSAGRPGEVYNITAYGEATNLEIVTMILGALGASPDLVEHVGDRPGHDRRYSVDASKIREHTGWRPARDLGEALGQTVDWYVANPGWWGPLADERTLHPQPWTLHRK